MKNKKEVKISFWASHFTSIVSVTLVLVLVGILAMVWCATRIETRRLKEQVEINLVLTDSATNSQAEGLVKELSGKPYVLHAYSVSKEEAMASWARETGENLEELYGVNPLSPEVRFSVRSNYSNPGMISKISEENSRNALVESVDAPDGKMVETMNRNLGHISGFLGVIAVIMLVISFVLINNTVRLAIYSRRFTIYTMQLVGATNGFIARPIVGNNVMCGLISGVAASLLLGGGVYGAPWLGYGVMSRYLDWWMVGAIGGSLILMGMILCGLTSWIATSTYLRKDYGELFK